MPQNMEEVNLFELLKLNNNSLQYGGRLLLYIPFACHTRQIAISESPNTLIFRIFLAIAISKLFQRARNLAWLLVAMFRPQAYIGSRFSLGQRICSHIFYGI